jgi:very-short-patch-repair endonuclease
VKLDKGIKKSARKLRQQQTDAEKKLWRFLRSREFQGIKFRRQQPLGSYIADFCSHQAMLIIELDGSQHALNREKDAKRTQYLKKAGFQVLRFWDNEVLVNTQSVLEIIRQNIK